MTKKTKSTGALQEYKPNRFARLIIIFIFLAVVSGSARLIGGWVGTNVGTEVSNVNFRSPESVQGFADDVRAHYEPPVMIDDITRLDDVRGNGSSIRYEYTVVGVDQSQVETAAEDIRNNTISNICGTEDTREILNRGVGMEFDYSTDAMSGVINFTITENDCL